MRWSLLVVVGLCLQGCGGTGSCLFTTDAGYNYCQDFLGTEFSSSSAENTCAVGSGTYSSSACSMAGALGVCAIGSGTADNYQYTYTLAPGAEPGSVTVETLERACGLSGGTFTPG